MGDAADEVKLQGNVEIEQTITPHLAALGYLQIPLVYNEITCLSSGMSLAERMLCLHSPTPLGAWVTFKNSPRYPGRLGG